MKPLKVTQPLPIMFEELIGAVHVNALALVGIDKEEKNEKHLLMAVRGEAIPTPSEKTCFVKKWFSRTRKKKNFF